MLPPHPLTNFETQKCYQNEPRFNGVYLRNNFPKIKDGAYVINLDEYQLVETHQIRYFDSFGVEHIAKEIKQTCRQQKYYNK